MNIRVDVVKGAYPILIVAPHGADDINTVTIARELCYHLDCFGVINQGFERSDTVDVIDSKANCNRVDHVLSDVVREEFLDPILNLKQQLIYGRKYPGTLMIYNIHGCGDAVHAQAGEKVGVILGYGLGSQSNILTCRPSVRNRLINSWRVGNSSSWGEICEGKGGGKFAGRDSNNFNQYFRKYDNDGNVEAIQIEIPYCWRNTRDLATQFARKLGRTIADIHHPSISTDEPTRRVWV